MKALMLTASLLVANAAFAEDHSYGPYPDNYVTECASCHAPFPPQLLAASDWAKIMAQLDRHYGVNASLDPTRRAAIADFLASHSGRAERTDTGAADAQLPRITTSRWFVREHGSKTPRSGSFADCAACHSGAAGGDYSERGLRRPRDRAKDWR